MKKEIKKFAGLIVNAKTIILHYNDETMTVIKSQVPELFEKVNEYLLKGNIDAVRDMYTDVAASIAKFTKGTFKVEDNRLVLKGDSEPLPKVIAARLIELRDAKEDWQHLVVFWKKLKKNPDVRIREQLYGFMIKHKIPLTALGDLVVEKGVGISNGELVDSRTGKFDNSIGMVVKMDRSKCDNNPKNSCSSGLHVAAPEFVRRHWSDGITIQCEVSPENVVAVPNDYKDTKMRVCEYKVVGLGKGTPQSKLNISFDDLITVPSGKALRAQADSGERNDSAIKEENIKVKGDMIDFKLMTVGLIKKHIADHVDISIDTKAFQALSPKNKGKVVKVATEIWKKHLEHVAKDQKEVVDFTGKSAKDIIATVKAKFRKTLGGNSPRRARVLAQARELYEAKGITVKG